MAQGVVQIGRSTMAAAQDARATVQFWILEGLTPAQVWEALDRPKGCARRATWPMVLDVLLADVAREVLKGHAA